MGIQDRIGKRLRELRAEQEAGQRQLAQLERRREELEATLMRISGAILVLEELQGPEASECAADAPPPKSSGPAVHAIHAIQVNGS